MGGDLHLGAAAWTGHEPVNLPRKFANSCGFSHKAVPDEIAGELLKVSDALTIIESIQPGVSIRNIPMAKET